MALVLAVRIARGGVLHRLSVYRESLTFCRRGAKTPLEVLNVDDEDAIEYAAIGAYAAEDDARKAAARASDKVSFEMEIAALRIITMNMICLSEVSLHWLKAVLESDAYLNTSGAKTFPLGRDVPFAAQALRRKP